MSLERASACVKKGLWTEAWDALQQLPISERLCHEVFRIRLECSVKLEKWDNAEILIQFLGLENPANQLAVFRYHHASISRFLSLGEIQQAQESLSRALVVWSEGRETLEGDPTLRRLWLNCATKPRARRKYIALVKQV